MKEHLGKFGILYILLALGVGILIGQTDWFKKLIGTYKPDEVIPPAEGSVCLTGDSKTGTIKGGICVAEGDRPDDNPVLRVAPDNSTQKAGCVSPTINQGKYYCPPGKSLKRVNVGGVSQVLCC